jgi:hypothetical protein
MKIPTPVVIFNVKPRSATPVVEESEKVNRQTNQAKNNNKAQVPKQNSQKC